MNNIASYTFGVNPVRVVFDEEGQPLWVAKDVALALGYSWSGSSSVDHVPAEWRRRVDSVPTPQGVQAMTAFTEQGLYFFLGRSDKPAALPMQKWIAGEVLPSIRKTGGYNIHQFQVPQTLQDALRLAADALDAKAALECQVQELAPKAAFHDTVAACDDGQSVGEVAKILGTGQNRLFAWPRGKRILMASNLPYQEHIDAGRFKVIEQTWQGNSGPHVSFKTLITGKGLIWIQRMWSEEAA